MRPTSSKKKTPIIQSLYRSKTKSKNNTFCQADNPQLSSSRKLNKSIDPSKTQLLSMNNPKIMISLKSMGIIHAYRPSMLKECILHEKASFKKYQTNNGECNLNNIFIKTALITFRDWRQKINQKLTLILDAITESEDILQPQLQVRAKQIVEQLKNYSLKLNQQIEKIIALKDQSYKMSKLHQKYILLLQTLEHVLKLINIMQGLNQDVNGYLQGTKNSDLKNVKALEEGVRRIAEKYEEKASDSLNYCSCHPDNKMLLKLYYKVRKMFKSSTLKVVTIFQSILELQKYQQQFKQQLQLLQNYQDFSHQYLVHSLEILCNKNQQLKLISRKVLVSKQPQFTTLRNRIQDWQTNFIKKLRSKSIKYLRQNLSGFNSLRTLHLFKNKGKEYTQFKKQLLLLVKIYHQSQAQSNINAQYYEFQKKSVNQIIALLTDSIKNTSAYIQQIMGISQKLQSMRVNKTSTPMKQVQKYCEQLDILQKTQSLFWMAINELYVNVSRLQNVNPESLSQNSYQDKSLLNNLYSLLIYSKNQQKNNDIFQQLTLPPQQDTSILLSAYNDRYNTHFKFAQGQLLIGLQKCKELKNVLREQLVAFLFQNQFKSQFIMGYPIIRQVCVIDQKVRSICTKQYINSTKFYRYSPTVVEQIRKGVNEQIQKLDKSKNRNIFNKYIVFIYQNILIHLLNMPTIHSIFINNQNHLQPYRAILHQYVDVYASLFPGNAKTNQFSFIASEIYEIASHLDAENKLAFQYSNSQKTNQYFPASWFIDEWMQYQFSAQIQQSISKNSIANKRSQIKLAFYQFINKLEGQRQKLKGNKMAAQSKDIYQHITINLNFLRKFNFQQSYKELLTKVINYLRELNINHSVVYTQDDSPILVMVHAADQQTISKLLLNRLHIQQYNKNHSFLTSFQPKFSIHREADLASKASTPFRLIEKKKEDQQMIQQISMPQQQSHIEQLPIEQINENLPISSVMKAVYDKSAVEQQISKVSVNTLNQSSIRMFNYYKLQHIPNTQTLKQCLSYLNNQYSTIQSKIRVDILCQTLYPSSSKKPLNQHLSQILQQLKKHDFLKIMKIRDSPTQPQQKLISFLQIINSQKSNFAQKLTDFIEYFKIESKVLYQQQENIIKSYKKYNQNQSFLYISLTQNCYKNTITAFALDHPIKQIWKNIYSNNISSKQINSLIDKSNELINTHYQSIQGKLSVFNKVNALNGKQAEQKLENFMNVITNKRYKITNIKGKISSTKDLIAYIGQLQKSISNLSIAHPYYTFTFNQTVLYFAQQPISEPTIAYCLNLPQYTHTLNTCITSQNQLTAISSVNVNSTIMTLINSNSLNFTIVKQYLQSHSKAILQNQYTKRSCILQTINFYRNYAKMYDSQLANKLLLQQQKTNKELSLLTFLLQRQISSIQKLQDYSYNRQIQLKQEKGRKKEFKYYEPSFLGQLTKKLTTNSIQHHTMHYAKNIVHVLEGVQKEALADWLCLNPKQTAILQQNITFDNCLHTINKLSVTFVNLIPSFDNSQLWISQEINEYLQYSAIKIKSGKNIYTINGLEASKNKFLEVEVQWPKNNLYIQFYNPKTKIQVKIQSNQYYYFSQIQILTIQEHLKQFHQQLQTKYLINKKSHEEEVRLQKIKKEEQLKQLLQLEQQKQLIRLRNEQQMAKIKYQTEQINRKMRQKDAQQKIRLKFIQQTLWKKLQQQQQQNRGKQEVQLKQKLNCIFDQQQQKAEQVAQQYDLQFEMVLSEGQDQYYNQGKHTKQYNYQYDYTKTLYEHIREKYHALRKKQEVDVESWLHYF